MTRIPLVALFLIGAAIVPMAEASESPAPAPGPSTADLAERTVISGQWFLTFRAGNTGGEKMSRFSVERGYINIHHQLSDRLSGRITPDVSVDRDGDGEGDLEMRLKYCFVEYEWNDYSVLAEPRVEFGLVHRPWLDFEEAVNAFRVQGPMFLERYAVFNSGDFGLSFFALLGGLLDEGYRKSVSGAYPGRYGSLALGMYNGGGYHAIERNNNKTAEGRITLRPLPSVLPGLQLSYHGVFGDGNTAEAPRWTVNLFHASLEHARGVLTGQYYLGEGDFSGRAVSANGSAASRSGFSVFGELRLGGGAWSAIARHDEFEYGSNGEDGRERLLVGGFSRRISERAKVLVDYETTTRGSWSDPDEELIGFRTEVRF